MVGVLWRGRLLVAGLLAIGILNLLPGMVALWPARAADLYGVAIDSDALALLLRHRAVMLALIGLGLISAILQPDWRTPAIAAALVSKISFVGLWALLDMPGPALDRVAWIDLAVLPFLALMMVAVWRGR